MINRNSLALVALSASLIPMACGDRPAPEQTATTEVAEPAHQVAQTAGLLNPNLASVEELASVPGMSSEAAQAIVDGRPYLTAAALNTALNALVGAEQAAEVYRTVWVPINLNDVTNEEVLLIPGVGDRMAHEFEEYKPYAAMDVFRREMGKYVDNDEVERLAMYAYVPIDLNTATQEEILAVPGVGERMAHEFEEYRPYTTIEQFRREIGKYVDESEVARLERYVTIN
ncbi:MAG: helix-hairpin-helix domain-containing protein [Longimicrobiales bacterium]